MKGSQAKKKTMSAPVKYGEAWKLIVKNRLKERIAPPIAAIRVHRPSKTPRPIATSAKEMTSPIGLAKLIMWLSSAWIGLVCEAAMSCAWIEIGLCERKKFGLASFCSPA